MIRIISLLLFPSLFFFFSCQEIKAKPHHLFKIASLAPEGSVWVQSFRQFADEVTEKTGGDVRFRIYPGGVMGDDKTMYRKMRVGQLHGGGFTMTGIADIVPDFRVMAIPFVFRSYDEVDHVKKVMLPFFDHAFRAKGLQFIAFTEVGFVYTFSNKPRSSIEDLQLAKAWSPANDPLSTSFLQSLDISPITLTIPDVLSSLQSGLINTVFNSLYGAIVLQWYTKAPFVTDQPYGYAYGAFVINGKAFAGLSEEQQNIIRKAAEKYFPDLIQKTRQSNRQSREVLISQGVTFVPITETEIKTLEYQRDTVIRNLKGLSFSEASHNRLQTALDDFRREK